MTQGMKTSEFYVTVLVTGAAFYLATIGTDAGSIAAICSPGIAYIGGRSYNKKGS